MPSQLGREEVAHAWAEVILCLNRLEVLSTTTRLAQWYYWCERAWGHGDEIRRLAPVAGWNLEICAGKNGEWVRLSHPEREDDAILATIELNQAIARAIRETS